MDGYPSGRGGCAVAEIPRVPDYVSVVNVVAGGSVESRGSA